MVAKRRAPATPKNAKNKKQKKVVVEEEPKTEVEIHMDTLVDAIMNEKYPVAGEPCVRSMLASVIRNSLCIFKSDRHEYQTQMLGCVAEAVLEIRKSLDITVNEIQALMDNAEAKRTDLVSVSEAAATEQSIKTEDLEKAQEALKERQVELKEAEGILKESRKMASDMEDEIEEMQERKESLRQAQEEWFASLMTGNCDDVEGAVAKLQEVLNTMNLDDSLIASAPNALKKDADKRGTFDVMVVNYVAEQLTCQRQDLDRQIVEKQEAQRNQQVEVESKEKIVEECIIKRDASKECVAVCKTNKSDAIAAAKSGEKAIKQHDQAVQTAESDMEDANEEVKQFQLIQSAFAWLDAREDKVEEPVVEPVEEVVVTEEPSVMDMEASVEVAVAEVPEEVVVEGHVDVVEGQVEGSEFESMEVPAF